jgi:hypothetical protein
MMMIPQWLTPSERPRHGGTRSATATRPVDDRRANAPYAPKAVNGSEPRQLLSIAVGGSRQRVQISEREAYVAGWALGLKRYCGGGPSRRALDWAVRLGLSAGHGLKLRAAELWFRLRINVDLRQREGVRMPQRAIVPRRIRGGASRAQGAGQAALDRLTQSVDAAQEALKDLRKELTKGTRDVLRDLDTTLTDARKNLRSVSKTVTQDLESIQRALITGKPAPTRAARQRKSAATRPTARKTTTTAKAARVRKPPVVSEAGREQAAATAVSSEQTSARAVEEPTAEAAVEEPTAEEAIAEPTAEQATAEQAAEQAIAEEAVEEPPAEEAVAEQPT